MVRYLRAGLLAIALAGAAARVAADETIDRVLAMVGGQLIMLSDVTAARDFGLVQPQSGGDPVGAMLAALIDRELMLGDVDRYGPPDPADEAVDREVDAVRARFPSQQAFDAALARSGLDVAHLRQWVRDDIRIREYLDERFGTDASRQAAVEEWLAGLRRRTNVIDLYLPANSQ